MSRLVRVDRTAAGADERQPGEVQARTRCRTPGSLPGRIPETVPTTGNSVSEFEMPALVCDGRSVSLYPWSRRERAPVSPQPDCRELRRLLSSGPTPRLSVLDVGSGPGTVDQTGKVEPGRATALETAEATLELSRLEAQRRGCTNMDFLVGDVHALQLHDNSFDVVHADQVLSMSPTRSLVCAR